MYPRTSNVQKKELNVGKLQNVFFPLLQALHFYLTEETQKTNSTLVERMQTVTLPELLLS